MYLYLNFFFRSIYSTESTICIYIFCLYCRNIHQKHFSMDNALMLTFITNLYNNSNEIDTFPWQNFFLFDLLVEVITVWFRYNPNKIYPYVQRVASTYWSVCYFVNVKLFCKCNTFSNRYYIYKINQLYL